MYLKLILIFLLFGFIIFNFIKPSISKLPALPRFQLAQKPTPIEKYPYPNLESIFSDNHNTAKNLDPNKKIVLIATGDVIPARSVNYQTTARNNFKWPFERVADIIKDADITFINLETPLLDNCPVTQQGMIFCGSSKHLDGLAFAGVDIASLANNHAGNWGEIGVEETVEHLTNAGIQATGHSNQPPANKTIKGTRFTFLGFNDITKPQPGINNVDDQKVCGDIKAARKNADVVLVTFHWGAEYRGQPDERQKQLGHLAIDCGADLIIGNHPHWIQPVEIYQGKLITYAHGNFIFDQEWSEKTKLGVVGKYTFQGKNLVDIEYLPVKIIDYGQPYFLQGEEKQRILEEMKQESLRLHQDASGSSN